MSAETQHGALRDREWQRFLRGPDQALLEELYVPALSRATRYDRCCAYFSSSVLAAAARGFGSLIARLIEMGANAPRPAVRLIVNEELAEDDVRALTETGDIAALEALLLKHLKNPKDALEKKRLAMLGWLVNQGLLKVRVGVMRRGEGIVHAKFGVIADPAGDCLVFSGSGNESAQGLRANYEEIEVTASWQDATRYTYFRERFDALWADRDSEVHTVTLPEALRLKLIKFAPKEPPTVEPSNALARQRAAMLWQFIAEAPYLPEGEAACDATAMVDMWPHQRRVVSETADAWPDGRLLCDEVGMGKTVEAVLALRRLLAGRGVQRVLILVPAGLLIQWQAELREKGGLLVPRLEGINMLVWPDGRDEKLPGLSAALARDVLLMSRETARTENNLPVVLAANPWDLLVLDEAHAARREKQVEGEFNNATLLLELLRQLQLQGRARALMLLSATPMQTQPWEPWDLLAVLGEGGGWLAEFSTVRNFYRAAHAVDQGRCDMGTAKAAAQIIAADPDFPELADSELSKSDVDTVAKRLVFAPAGQRAEVARWLRRGSPLARRMHRNTRQTLRGYYAQGLLAAPPARRNVEDCVFDFQDAAERRVYDEVTRYIERRFQELESEKPGKGFVMTIYRRRAASSYSSLQRSLMRREEGLTAVAGGRARDEYLDEDLGLLDEDEAGEIDMRGRVSAAFPTSADVARKELNEVHGLLEHLRALGNRDSKRDFFFGVLRRITDDGRAVLVFTEYSDTLDYLKGVLVDHYGTRLGCYSGRGGEWWDGSTWQSESKSEITHRLQTGQVRVLVCTDAASEGLNLQAAGALINYDLPWNPSKVEQRIGRIDRIGQKLEWVKIVNLFLADSVDERVYRTLRERCGLFEHFVGPMQPVLARARRILIGKSTESPSDLAAAAAQTDPLAEEIYLESEAEAAETIAPPLRRDDLRDALLRLNGEFGPTAKQVGDEAYRITGIAGTLALSTPALERNAASTPLSPFSDVVRELASGLQRPAERLPLVLGSFQAGAFRTTVAAWVGSNAPVPLNSYADLRRLVDAWDGQYPDAGAWIAAEHAARQTAEGIVAARAARALERERAALKRQVHAARLRLLREVGRYLVCLGEGTSDLNDVWYRYMLRRDVAGGERLRRAHEMLGGYPEWETDLLSELGTFDKQLPDGQRRARLAGKEVDAALNDPRWIAVKATAG